MGLFRELLTSKQFSELFALYGVLVGWQTFSHFGEEKKVKKFAETLTKGTKFSNETVEYCLYVESMKIENKKRKYLFSSV